MVEEVALSHWSLAAWLSGDYHVRSLTCWLLGIDGARTVRAGSRYFKPLHPPSVTGFGVGRERLAEILDVYAPWGKDMAEETEKISKGLVEGVIDALTDKHSQLDLRLRGLTLSLGDSRLSLRVSGDVTVAVHLRDLMEDEKAAHVAANVASIRS